MSYRKECISFVPSWTWIGGVLHEIVCGVSCYMGLLGGQLFILSPFALNCYFLDSNSVMVLPVPLPLSDPTEMDQPI